MRYESALAELPRKIEKIHPHTNFQEAERHEGKGRVAFEEWKISLPQELSHRENMAMTRDLVDAIAGERLPITYAFHDPTTMDGANQQPHLHLLISARKTDEYSRTPAQHFKRFNRAEPWRGGAEKDPAFYHLGEVKAQRVMISDVMNMHLERAGQMVRVHPDTLERRGLPRAPEPKLLPSESRQYREHGIISERMGQVLAMRAQRAQQIPMEQDNAFAYWEGRKQALGIAQEMPHDQRLTRIVEARARLVQEPATQRRVPIQALAIEAKDLQ
jgi:hypothetical protein